MAKHNFLKLEYRNEEVQALEIVGVVDGDGVLPAYTTTDKNLKWNAWIVNKNRRLFQFVPVDCNIPIYKDNGVDMESRCDGMLLVDSMRYIAFVELKDVRSGGIADAIKQLRTTIELFSQNHHVEDFRIRRAYAANVAHPRFHYSMKDEIESFRALKFVLMPQAEIVLN